MKIVKCTCSHAWQDSKYGKGKRAQNKTDKPGGKTYRCTVCGRENSSGK